MSSFPEIPVFDKSCQVIEPQQSYSSDTESYTNYARKDNFELVLTLPCGLKRRLVEKKCINADEDRFIFTINAYSVPETTIQELDFKYRGTPLAISSHGRSTYSPVTVNFVVDNRYNNYYILWEWLKLLNDGNYNYSKNIGDYSCKINIIAMDNFERERPVMEWVFNDCFINKLGSLNISQKETDQIETDFSFKFNSVEMNKTI